MYKIILSNGSLYTTSASSEIQYLILYYNYEITARNFGIRVTSSAASYVYGISYVRLSHVKDGFQMFILRLLHVFDMTGNSNMGNNMRNLYSIYVFYTFTHLCKFMYLFLKIIFHCKSIHKYVV